MIYTVTLNPALDKTAVIPDFTLDNVNRISQLRSDPGGKGINVSKVIQALGGNSVPVAVLAGHTGEEISGALKDMGLTGIFQFVPGNTRTNLKIVDNIRHTNTDINEPGTPVSMQVLNALQETLRERLAPGDTVILSGSLPPETPAQLYRDWCASFQSKGAKVFLDAEGEILRLGLEAKPYLIKPNRQELERHWGKTFSSLDMLVEAGKTLINDGVSNVVISLGAQGALFFMQQDIYYSQGVSVAVASTVGAGDSMVAALAYGLSRNMPREEILRLAIATSAANVMCSGTQPASLDSVLSLLPKVTVEKIN